MKPRRSERGRVFRARASALLKHLDVILLRLFPVPTHKGPSVHVPKWEVCALPVCVRMHSIKIWEVGPDSSGTTPRTSGPLGL